MAIHRHDALRPLSRDHHLALQLARGIQRSASAHLRAELPSEKRALIAHVQKIFAEELEPHFEVEDAVLAPAVAGKDEQLDHIMSDIESEHAEMMALTAKLSSLKDSEIEETLDHLGQMLENHVRREEREYYARIQEVLDDASLEELGTSLGRHLVYHGKSARKAVLNHQEKNQS